MKRRLVSNTKKRFFRFRARPADSGVPISIRIEAAKRPFVFAVLLSSMFVVGTILSLARSTQFPTSTIFRVVGVVQVLSTLVQWRDLRRLQIRTTNNNPKARSK